MGSQTFWATALLTEDAQAALKEQCHVLLIAEAFLG